MSKPILYSPTETSFDNNGIGILNDCASCLVIEEANGAYELEMKYPMDGIHYLNIVDRCLIKAKPNREAKPQLFRVYSISKPMHGVVSVYAAHISYDLSGIPVSPFYAPNASLAMEGLLRNAVIDCPFTFTTDKATTASFSATIPGSIRSKLGGSSGSILDVFGGEYEFDNYNVILHNSRGQNRGVSIRYGKNLTDIKQDRGSDSVYTGVYPYWVNIETQEVSELPEKIVNSEGNYNFVKIKMLNASETFIEKPTEEELRNYAELYIKNNEISVPSVSISVSFKQLEQTEEYRGMALLEKVSLFDTVNVEFPALGVSANSKAVKIVYNVLLDRVESVTLGKVRAKITDTLANQQMEISKTPTLTDVQRALKSQTHEDIFNALTNNGQIQGIYVQDGKWYINAQVAKIINLSAESIDTTNLKVAAANITGTLTASQIDVNSLKVKATNITGTLTASQINGDGLTANNATISGKITATSGAVGGWQITANGLYRSATDGQIRLIPAGNLSINYTVNGYATTAWVMLCGPDNTTTANFGVTKAGKLYAKDANLSGTINATNGKIGNWTVSAYGYLEGSGGANTIRLYPKGVQYSGYTFYLVVYDSGGAVPIGGITASGWKTL